MNSGARAARASVAALAGFLIVAGLQLAAVLLVLWIVLSLLPSTVALRAGVPLSIATFGAAGYATWRALHTRYRVPAGVVVTRDDAPRLWELVDKAAAAAGVRRPESVTVVADATVVLGERTRLLGLLGGRRDLYLGLPLLMAWDPDRLRAVVAHELAHYSPKSSRWAPIAYRGRVAVSRVVPRISRRNPAGAVLRAYAGWYRRVDAPFSREQELAADRIAAEHAGVGPAVAALRDLPALAGMQRLFHAEYVGPGWQAGHVPDDIFGGLLRVLAARSADLTRLRTREPEPVGPWDTHPPLADRLAALTPSEQPSEESPEAAEELVPDLPELGRALQAVAFPPGGRAVVSWDEFLSLARTTEMEREAQATLATISRAVGTPVSGPEQVLELAGNGRLREAAGTIFPGGTPEETTARIVDLLGLMLALAALRSGIVRWRHSWTGAAEVVGVGGAYLNLAELAVAAADPETTAAVREYLEKIGVDLAAPADGAGPARAQALGGLVNLTADGERTDLLITDLGLRLLPGLPRGRTAEARRRLTRIAGEGIPAENAGRFVPFVDVASVTELPGRRRGWVIGLRDGGSLTLRPAFDTEELPGGWSAWDDAVAFLAGTR
ncbi:M48 family metalloprotease [Actinoplanes sp. NBC_00393]|uniref:M48 family metalloprotease n=1 Tax=Actinoplanes sp. NBC_00393 TaxID=2975953 RepID=UPI002E24DE3B